MRQAWIGPEALGDHLVGDTQRRDRSEGGSGVLGVVHAAQRADAREVRHDTGHAAGDAHQPDIERAIIGRDAGKDAVIDGGLGGNPLHRPAAGRPAGCDAARDVIVDADDGMARGSNQPLLDGGIVLDRAVAVDVVRRHVEMDADAGVQRGGQVDLEG